MGRQRRRLLAALGAAGVTALAGCSEVDEVVDGGDTDPGSGDASTAVVGAWRDDDPNGNDAGSAYVFG